jgi:hypothetical protein
VWKVVVCFAARPIRMLRRADPSRCPTCRERVTPLAAGCALCGTGLDPLRHRAGPSAAQRIGTRASALWMGPTKAKPVLTRWRTDPTRLAGVVATWLYGGLIVGAVVAGVAVVVAGLT